LATKVYRVSDPSIFQTGKVKTTCGLDFLLSRGKKFPIVIYQAYKDACAAKGYPCHCDFGTDTPFAQDWANETINPV
jgi:hypothetical protein